MRLTAKAIIINAANQIGINEVTELSDTPTSIILPLPRIDFEILPSNVKNNEQSISKLLNNNQTIIRKQTHTYKFDTRCIIRIPGENENEIDEKVEGFISAIPAKIRTQTTGNLIKIETSKAEISGFKNRIVDVLTQRAAAVYISFNGYFYKDITNDTITDININSLIGDNKK